MMVEPEKFLNLVYAPSSLEERIKSVNWIISPRDVYEMRKKGAEVRVEGMPKKELQAILISLKNKDGKEPYQRSNIHITRTNPSNNYWFQVFVQRDKLIHLSGLVEILEEYGYLGLAKVPALYLIVNTENGKFLAIYLPPIVEIRPSYEIIEYGLEIIDKIMTGSEKREYILPGIYGDVKIDVLKVIEEVIKKSARSNAVMLILDGTHRNYLIYLSGTTIQSIVVEKPDGPLETFPVLKEHLVITREKPAKEYRFIGLNERAWLNLKEIGIDG